MHKCLHDNNFKSENCILVSNYKLALNSHCPDTRFSSQYCLVSPQPKKEYFKRSFYYNGIKIWNKIPFTIKSVQNITSFKHKYNTTNVKNMHLHRDSNPGPWNTVPML